MYPLNRSAPGPMAPTITGSCAVAGCSPVDAGLPRDHAPERVLRRVAEIAIEQLLLEDRIAKVAVEPEPREILGDELVQRRGIGLVAERLRCFVQRDLDLREHLELRLRRIEAVLARCRAEILERVRGTRC